MFLLIYVYLCVCGCGWSEDRDQDAAAAAAAAAADPSLSMPALVIAARRRVVVGGVSIWQLNEHWQLSADLCKFPSLPLPLLLADQIWNARYWVNLIGFKSSVLIAIKSLF